MKSASGKKKLENCNKCGCKFKSKVGMKKHNCTVYADNLKMDHEIVTDDKTVNSNEKKVTFASEDKNQDVETIGSYIDRSLPGRKIMDVVSDGSCLPRALSLIIFAIQGHWWIIARAINKFMIERWNYLLSTKTVVFPMEKIVKGKLTIFNNDDEFLDFLKTEESLFLWREHHDLAIIADLLNVPINVIMTRENMVKGHIEIPTSDENKSDIVKYEGGSIVLLFDVGKSHYKAIVPPGQNDKNVEIRHKLLSYLKLNESHISENMQDNEIIQNSQLKSALVNAEKSTLEVKEMMSDMKQKMEAFEAELFVVKNQNYLLNAELQALKAEIAEREKISSQEEMDWSQGGGRDEDAEVENVKQLEEIKRMKNSGYDRVNPQVPSSKKPQLIKCVSCELEFDSDENLKKHTILHHQIMATGKPRSVKCVTCDIELNSETDLKTHMESHKNDVHKHDVQGSNPNNIAQTVSKEATTNSIPALHRVDSRQYNCHQCSFQGNNSKNLYRHFRITGHMTDKLSEVCYTCDKSCENFEELMVHRKQAHPLAVRICRYFQENKYCKFEGKCYYSHTFSQSTPQQSQQVFQKEKEPSPPDQSVTDLLVMLKDLMSTYIQVRGGQSDKGRNLGN